MKNLLTVSILFLISFQILAADEGRFMKYPDIYKDKIVFTYENDLWLASINGGTAVRLTSAPGREFAAKFSPDGNWIAFTGEYDGSTNIYLLPSSGGEPKRITYLPSSAQSVAWTPDGEKIIFRSGFENTIGRDTKLFSVSKNGSAPERLPLDRGVLCSFSPDGSKMIYNRRGSEEYYWKRYKGGQYQDIWMYDFTTDKFNPISDYVGKNSYPMWVNNKMYFVSDRSNGIANLYIQDLTTKEIVQLTRYSDFDIMFPEYDNSSIIYMQNGYLNLLDVASGKTKKLSVDIPSDKWERRERFINPKDYIHWVNVSNDGKTTVLEARGDIFKLNSGTVNLSNSPGIREMYPSLSPDGKYVAFFSDKTGEYQLYLMNSNGGEWIPLTKDMTTTFYNILWSPDSKKILFGSKDFDFYYVDINSKNVVKFDESRQAKNDEFFWEMNDYSWSPDSKWICYSITKFNKNNQVFVYNTETGKKYPVTSDFYDNLYPSFDANGKYLYYVSSRDFTIQMDFYEDNHIESTPQQVMVVQLRDGDTPPFLKSLSNNEEKKNDEAFRIDTEGLQSRTYPLPVPAGNYFHLKAGNGKVAWSSVPKFTEAEYEEIFKPGADTKWDLHIFDMNSQTETILNDKIRMFDVSPNREQLIIQKNKDYSVISFNDAVKTKTTGSKIDLSNLNYRVNPVEEWTQIFNDAWRWYRNFFYDKNMHGKDWIAMGKKYKEYIPYLSTRDDLNWVLSQMVGELSVSHTYVSGGDRGDRTAPTTTVYTGWLGADLTPDKTSGFYKFSKIYGPTDINLNLKSPLVRPDIDLKEGDYLIAINGNEIRVPEDYFKYLQVSPGQKVSVTINDNASKKGAKTYEIEPIKYSRTLRYFRWLNDNVNYVQEKSGGRLGYMHINAMGAGGIGEFDKFWRAFRYKEGIVIDVRSNGGGWTEYFIIDKLERKMTAYNNLSGMAAFRYPGSTSTGKFAVISNEDNGSDGEAFIEDFKANKLGTVIGVPSWGGLVGILNGQTTIDNGTIHQSNNAFYGKDGKWLVENHGADPDIVIDNDPSTASKGIDRQLDEAIKTILEQVQKGPFTWPDTPEYPVR